MPRVTESSAIITRKALEEKDRDPPAIEAWAPSEREWRERQRLDDAERRARWAEQDRENAIRREREQHRARVEAMQRAIVERVRIETAAEHERNRLLLEYEHEQAMARLRADACVQRLRRKLLGVSLVCVFTVVMCAVVLALGR